MVAGEIVRIEACSFHILYWIPLSVSRNENAMCVAIIETKTLKDFLRSAFNDLQILSSGERRKEEARFYHTQKPEECFLSRQIQSSLLNKLLFPLSLSYVFTRCVRLPLKWEAWEFLNTIVDTRRCAITFHFLLVTARRSFYKRANCVIAVRSELYSRAPSLSREVQLCFNSIGYWTTRIYSLLFQ